MSALADLVAPEWWRGLLVAVVLALGCKASGPQVASAAVTTGMAVAATGVYRAATGGCVAACRHGFECDEESGTCVRIPCGGECPADHECRGPAGAQSCARMVREGPAEANPCSPAPQPAPVVQPAPVAQPSPVSPPTDPASDPCGGLCFTGTSCEVVDGAPRCVSDDPEPKPDAPARADP